MTDARIAGLRARMREHALDALLVTSLADIRYLTGFSGSNALVVLTTGDAFFVSD
jgi:Xaa-Pro aminopeptidase